MDRRKFLGVLTDGLFGLIALMVALPSAGYVFAPLRRKAGAGAGAAGAGAAAAEDEYVDLGPAAGLPLDKWELLPIEVVRTDGWEQVHQKHSVWVRRLGPGDQDISVLSPICPHLGCPVNQLADGSGFKCPCHGGTFNATGHYVSGPPPRSMDPLPFKVQDGRLLVRWEDFRIGVSERTPVAV